MKNRLKITFALMSLLVLALLAIANASALKTFEIDLTIEGLDEKIVKETTPDGYEFEYIDFGDYSVKLNEIRVVESEQLTDDSEITDKTAEGVFKAEIASDNDLSTLYFAPSFLILSDPPIEVNISEVLLYMPYSRAKYLRVYKGNEIKLEVNIADLVCNNDSKCDNFETYLSCSDCKWYDNDTICNSDYNDSYCDWDCSFDADVNDPEAECFKPNCNNGKLTGAICQKYKCDNGLKDVFEEDIDCGGVCEDECPVDFCGDGICAEYEDNENCAKDCPNKLALASYIENLGSEPLQGYLFMLVEKLVDGKWQKHAEVINDFVDGNLRTIAPYEKLNVRDIFNSKNYVAESGIYRLKTEFVDENGKIIETSSGLLSEYSYFNVSLPIQTNSEILKQEWTSETSYRIEVEGADGTSGFIEIQVDREPKTILFDGTTLEKGTDWFYENGIIKINYQHSKHEIDIEFKERRKYGSIFIIGVILLIIAVIFVIYEKLKPKEDNFV